MKPRSYQTRALDELRENDWTGLVRLETGYGKSLNAAWAAQEAGAESVLVVAPKRTQLGWDKTFGMIGVDLKVASKANKKEKANLEDLFAGAPGYYWITWELARSMNVELRFDGRKRANVRKAVSKPFNGRTFDMLIADESQRLANHRSQNYEVISRVRAKAKIALSATPAGNQPVRIWATLNLLWPDKYPAFGRFSEKYFNWEPNPFADYVIPGTDKVVLGKTWGSERRPGYLKTTAPCWIEATKEEQAEVAQEEPVRHVIPVRMGVEQKRIYMEWYEDALAWLDDHPVAAALPITKEIRLRQAALGTPTVDDTGSVVYAPDSKSSKIEALLDLLSDMPEGEPVIVWTHSQRFMVPLLAQLRKAGYSAIEVSGKSKDSYTDLIDGTAQILCAVPEAMAEGTDGLQSVCATEVWLSLSTSVIINKQARGRIARQGQKRLVNSYLIQSIGTIDDRVVGRLDERFNTLKESGFID